MELPELMKDMNEPELIQHLKKQMDFVRSCQTPDTIGAILILFTDCGIAEYASTIDPSTAPAALRQFADQLEKREVVER